MTTATPKEIKAERKRTLRRIAAENKNPYRRLEYGEIIKGTDECEVCGGVWINVSSMSVGNLWSFEYKPMRRLKCPNDKLSDLLNYENATIATSAKQNRQRRFAEARG